MVLALCRCCVAVPVYRHLHLGRLGRAGSLSVTDNNQSSRGQPSISQAALFGLCPKCGAQSLYAGKLVQADIQFTRECHQCGLDFSAFNVGDGPAAFLTLIIGAVMVGLALWLDVALSPPFWVHALIWVPLTAAAVIYGLRVSKAALLASEFRHNAHEAKNDEIAADDLEDDAR